MAKRSKNVTQDDVPYAEKLAEAWGKRTGKLLLGGPGTGMRGGEFKPGMYLKKGYVITSRGCPNSCWFCFVPNREGDIRELEIRAGWNLLDDNLLACSKEHILKVFKMLLKVKNNMKTIEAGFILMAMVYRDEKGIYNREWTKFQKEWARPAIMRAKGLLNAE